jgi:peptidoglycan/xylan/chitin deacetylase (PgdA/CDA1 family)
MSYIYGRRGILLRLVLLSLSLLVWCVTGCGRLRRRRAVILCYHGVSRHQQRRFARQMARVAGRSCDLTDGATRRAAFLTLPKVCITFDDAFAELCDFALLVTERLHIQTTVFAVSDVLGRTPTWAIGADHPDARKCTMTASQLRTISSLPHCTVGSHTATHPYLTDLDAPAQMHELAGSRLMLEQKTGREITAIAFPHGDADPAVWRRAASAGYSILLGLSNVRPQTVGTAVVLPRLSMSPDVWPLEFMLTINGAYDWLPLARRLRHRIRPSRDVRPIALTRVSQKRKRAA